MGVEPSRFLEAAAVQELVMDVEDRGRLACVRAKIRLADGEPKDRRAWCLVTCDFMTGALSLDNYDRVGRLTDSSKGDVTHHDAYLRRSEGQQTLLCGVDLTRIGMAALCMRRAGHEAAAACTEEFIELRAPALPPIFRRIGWPALAGLIEAAPHTEDFRALEALSPDSWIAVAQYGVGKPGIQVDIIRYAGTQDYGVGQGFIRVTSQTPGLKLVPDADGRQTYPVADPNPPGIDVDFSQVPTKIILLSSRNLDALRAFVPPEFPYVYKLDL
jgi:hypothetical protein